MRKLFLLILISQSIVFTSCKKTVIVGKVFDGFDNPVKDATVKIEGTQFTCQTSGDGSYSVGYVPGNIKVTITKQGFTETSFPLNISTESTFPAENKAIYEIPNEKGVWYMDFEKKQYVPLNHIGCQVKKWDSSRGFSYSESESYTVQEIDKYKTPIFLDNTRQLVFLDNDSKSQSLVELHYAPRENSWEILKRVKSNGDFGFMAGDFIDEINIQKSDNVNLGNGLTLLKVNLEPNTIYSFINYVKKSKNPIQGMAYLVSTGENATRIIEIDPSEIDR